MVDNDIDKLINGTQERVEAYSWFLSKVINTTTTQKSIEGRRGLSMLFCI
jgi:hypothetical protein